VRLIQADDAPAYEPPCTTTAVAAGKSWLRACRMSAATSAKFCSTERYFVKARVDESPSGTESPK